MPSNQPRVNGEPPLSPGGKGTATYSNKDGSKFITVRKPSGESTPVSGGNQTQQTGSSVLGASSGQTVKGSNGSAPASNTSTGVVGGGGGVVTGVNRKKQKRRQKQAARQAAEQQINGNQMTREDYVDVTVIITFQLSVKVLIVTWTTKARDMIMTSSSLRMETTCTSPTTTGGSIMRRGRTPAVNLR
ncbi:hypothetical protein GP486_007266 [Trichoglossum hirsutum]|uniref:Uncharacterized protein n=1 Tax=Trichoglossum hirsutum TaxID=265104 RepID=A0A9P8L2W3_9PEZI|nr:hypothetical protein GP486_007266 [Trichoglossum hirsutum]